MSKHIDIDPDRYEELLKFEREHGKKVPQYEINIVGKCLLCGQMHKEKRMSFYKKDLTYTIPKCEKCMGTLMMLEKDDLIKRLFDVINRYEIEKCQLRKEG